jgi:hypothetical protein
VYADPVEDDASGWKVFDAVKDGRIVGTAVATFGVCALEVGATTGAAEAAHSAGTATDGEAAPMFDSPSEEGQCSKGEPLPCAC